MRHIQIKRVAYTIDGTFGVLLDGNTPFALTLEEVWLNNVRNISCIPKGEYICKRVNTPKHGEVFQVMDVPNRTAILFHKGNTIEDTEGCILVGEQFEPINGKMAVIHSGKGYGEFMTRLKDESGFRLTIT